MGLFSRKPESGGGTKDNRTPIAWATNAPKHWPKIVSPPLPFDGGMEHPMNIVFFGARLIECFEKANRPITLASMKHDFLTRDGLLETPLLIQEGAGNIPVFFYGDASTNSSAHFEGARRVLMSLGKADPVYFAPRPLEKTKPANPLREFYLTDLTKMEESKFPEGQYCMWWKVNGEAGWMDSPCMREIDRFAEAVDGYESYFFGYFLHSQQLIKEMGRVALNDHLDTFPVSGPEHVPLMVSASAEKGLRFHFDKNTTRPYYRDAFYKLAADFAQRFRSTLEMQGVPRDETKGDKPIQWWKFAVKGASQLIEKGTDIQEFGRIVG